MTIETDERETKSYSIALFIEDIDYLLNQGYKITTIVRKIVSDYVAYHKVKANNPMKELPNDQE